MLSSFLLCFSPLLPVSPLRRISGTAGFRAPCRGATHTASLPNPGAEGIWTNQKRKKQKNQSLIITTTTIITVHTIEYLIIQYTTRRNTTRWSTQCNHKWFQPNIWPHVFSCSSSSLPNYHFWIPIMINYSSLLPLTTTWHMRSATIVPCSSWRYMYASALYDVQ